MKQPDCYVERIRTFKMKHKAKTGFSPVNVYLTRQENNKLTEEIVQLRLFSGNPHRSFMEVLGVNVVECKESDIKKWDV